MSMMDKLTGSIDSNNANSESSFKTETFKSILEGGQNQTPEAIPAVEAVGHDDNDPQYYSCCFPITKPSILLRNLIVPPPLWKFFPKGLGYNSSDYLLYQPDFPPESRIFVASPDQFGMPYEEVWIHTKDRVKIHAYLIKQMVSNCRNLPVLLFFHGNAGNIGSRLENAQLLFKEIKCHILLVEYRGYGRSEGTPSENGLYLDAQAAFEYIDAREDLDSKKIFLFGRSLGGAVAIDLAARCDFRDRVAGLIVENSFTSVPAIAKHLFPIRPVRWLPGFCYKNKFQSLSKISSVMCPTLFICGTEDEMIPEPMMTELHNKCSSSMKRLIRFAGGHNDTWMCDKNYPLQLLNFITEALDTERRPTFHTYSDNIV